MRRAAKTDANHGEIVDALRRSGCEVESLAAVGGGVADLLVYHRSTRRLMLVEVKDGSKSPSRQRLTEDQHKWHARFPVHILTDLEDVKLLLYLANANWAP